MLLDLLFVLVEVTRYTFLVFVLTFNHLCTKVSMFATMLSFLLLTVTSASLSENLMAENIISMTERLSSKLRMSTLELVSQQARHYKARRLGEGACMWDGDKNKCGLVSLTSILMTNG